MAKKLGGVPPINWSPEMDGRLIRLIKGGMNDNEIGAEFGFSSKSIYRRRKALNLGTFRTPCAPKGPRKPRAPRRVQVRTAKPAAPVIEPKPMKMFVDLDDLLIEKDVWNVMDVHGRVHAVSLAKVTLSGDRA